LKKSVFAAEFEERTGETLQMTWINVVHDMPDEWCFVTNTHVGFRFFDCITKGIFTRAHLEAAIEAVGEKQ